MFTRPAGSDLSDQDIIEAGSTIGTIELALLHMMGHKSITVFKKPIIGLMSTGDEIVSIQEYDGIDPSKVVDTNRTLLELLFESRGHKVVECGISRDDKGEVAFQIENGLKKCDILIITGGASMGSKDHVKDVITSMGGLIHFGRVNIKPGKPASFASILINHKQKFIFSLPGNPVSAHITSMVLVLPFIQHARKVLSGSTIPLSLNAIGPSITVRVASITDSSGDQQYVFDGRLEFMRAKLILTTETKLNSTLSVTVSIRQQSSRILSLRDCDCLIIIEPSSKGSKFLVGQTYPALWLRF